jgi:hypothetical protein
MSPRDPIDGLGPYPSLLLLALLTATVEPLKLAAAWAFTGMAMIAACYAFSLLVERLFVIVKPKLLKISWFAGLWEGFVALRTVAWRALKRWIGPRSGRRSYAYYPWPDRFDPGACCHLTDGPFGDEPQVDIAEAPAANAGHAYGRAVRRS